MKVNDTHPIEGLMKTAMNSIQDMVDVNTIIGEPIEISNKMVIIPISKVSFGFAAGGSEFNSGTIDEYRKKDKEEESKYKLPFGGGSGAGVSISPVAFIVAVDDVVKIMPIEHNSSFDRIVDYIPDVIEKFNKMMFRNNKSQDIQENIDDIKSKLNYDNEVFENDYLEDE